MVCVCVLLLLFFFFKQKTAYEMRISDWSSDVCSSDLLGRRAAANEPCAVFTAIGLSRHDAGLEKFARRRRRHFLHRHAALGGKIEIGRASCRERGCQYV